MRKQMLAATALSSLLSAVPALADMDAARRWVDSEFQPSTLAKDAQLKEMEWFVNAAKPFAGMEVNIVSVSYTHLTLPTNREV